MKSLRIAVVPMMLALLLAGAAVAQPVQDNVENKLMSHRLLQLARSYLTEPEPTHPARLAVSRALLDEASRLNPDDPELWRLKAEAADLQDDRAATRRALTQYLRLQPRDDAAQLRLVDLIASEQQTAEGRVEVYLRLLQGSKARQLSPALRSRIAIRAALLVKEQADLPRYGELLKQAIRLDESNKVAAAEAYQFLSHRGVGRAELAQALFNVLAADPSDPDLHAEVAAMLLQSGHYEQALSWFESAAQLWNYSQPPAPDALLVMAHDWALALWGARRPAEALAFIDSFLAGASGAEAGEPQPQRPVMLQTLTVALHAAQNNAGEASAAFEELRRTLASRSEADPGNVDLLADRAWAHLLLNQAIDQAEPLIEQVASARGQDDSLVQRLQGWLRLRRGDVAEAQNILKPCARVDQACKLGLALAMSDEGESKAGRLQLLQEIYRDASGRLIGLIAARELHRLDIRPQPGSDAMLIGRLAAQLPRGFQQLVSHPLRTALLRMTVLDRRLAYGDPIRVRFELTNTSPVPLALGRGGVIPTDVLITPEVQIDNQRSIAPPQMIDLQRRLRLDRNETIVVETTVDHGALGQLLWRSPGQNISVSINGVLRPVLRNQQLMPGLLGTKVVGGSVTRPRIVMTTDQVESLLQQFQGPANQESMSAAALLMRLAPALQKTNPDQSREIAGTMNQAYKNVGTASRAWLLSHSGSGEEAEVLFAPMLRDAAASDEPLIHYMLVLMHGREAESPVLTAALRQDPGAIRSFAENWRQILELRDQAARQSESQPPARQESEGQGDVPEQDQPAASSGE